jgi:hypothetical protein
MFLQHRWYSHGAAVQEMDGRWMYCRQCCWLWPSRRHCGGAYWHCRIWHLHLSPAGWKRKRRRAGYSAGARIWRMCLVRADSRPRRVVAPTNEYGLRSSSRQSLPSMVVRGAKGCPCGGGGSGAEEARSQLGHPWGINETCYVGMQRRSRGPAEPLSLTQLPRPPFGPRV